jgi:hypothetical protein
LTPKVLTPEEEARKDREGAARRTREDNDREATYGPIQAGLAEALNIPKESVRVGGDGNLYINLKGKLGNQGHKELVAALNDHGIRAAGPGMTGEIFIDARLTRQPELVNGLLADQERLQGIVKGNPPPPNERPLATTRSLAVDRPADRAPAPPEGPKAPSFRFPPPEAAPPVQGSPSDQKTLTAFFQGTGMSSREAQEMAAHSTVRMHKGRMVIHTVPGGTLTYEKMDTGINHVRGFANKDRQENAFIHPRGGITTAIGEDGKISVDPKLFDRVVSEGERRSEYHAPAPNGMERIPPEARAAIEEMRARGVRFDHDSTQASLVQATQFTQAPKGRSR